MQTPFHVEALLCSIPTQTSNERYLMWRPPRFEVLNRPRLCSPAGRARDPIQPCHKVCRAGHACARHLHPANHKGQTGHADAPVVVPAAAGIRKRSLGAH